MPLTYQEVENLLILANDLADTEIGQALVILSDKAVHGELTPSEQIQVSSSLNVLYSQKKVVSAQRFMGRLDKTLVKQVDEFNKIMANYFKKIKTYLKKISPKDIDYSGDVKYPGPITDEDVVSTLSMQKSFEQEQSVEQESLNMIRKYAEEARGLLLKNEDDIKYGIVNWLEMKNESIDSNQVQSLLDKTIDLIGGDITTDEIPGYIEYLTFTNPDSANISLTDVAGFSTLQDVVSKRQPKNIIVRKIEDAWKLLSPTFKATKDSDEVSMEEAERLERSEESGGRKSTSRPEGEEETGTGLVKDEE